MKLEIIKGINYCTECQHEYEAIRYGRICPKCHSEHTYLKQGNECNIKQIEAEE
jgi:hydrogenase nickel incorporation protein HypA/HybF